MAQLHSLVGRKSVYQTIDVTADLLLRLPDRARHKERLERCPVSLMARIIHGEHVGTEGVKERRTLGTH